MKNGRIPRRITAAALAACMAFMLSGCAGRGKEEKPAAPTLPPADVSMEAPDGDRAVRQAGNYTVYIPLADELQLTARSIHVEESSLQATVEVLAKALLEAVGGNSGGTLSLYRDQAPEISGGICTVNLDPSALSLSYSDYYRLSIALATTLCGLDEIDGINVLTADKSVALDTAGNLAMGTLTGHPGENLPVLWEQMEAKRAPLGNNVNRTPLSAAATIYYPLPDGRGIGCESQLLTFPGQTPDQLAETLMTALDQTMKRRSGNGNLPALADQYPDGQKEEKYRYLERMPVVTDRNNGGRTVNILFRNDIYELLEGWDTDLSCLIAAITCTMITFIPDVEEISVRIDGVPVTEMGNQFHPAATQSVVFQRSDAALFLTSTVSVFYEKDGKLVRCEKPVEREQADSPRAILGALLEGPNRRERENGINATLPAGVQDQDIQGIAADGDTLLVNLSGDFRDMIRDYGGDQEALLCYSMVNTLCFNSGMRRVCFFFDGVQAETIAGDIYWSGEFIYNPGI